MSQTIFLVSCVKKKASEPAPARDLYTSDLFQKCRAYVESKGPWYILSAKYGLVEPAQVIEPYEESLKTKGRAERKAWSDRVLAALLERTEPGDTVVILAGKAYNEHLVSGLEDSSRQVELPMGDLPFGARLAWLKAQLDGTATVAASPVRAVATSHPLANALDRVEHLKEFYRLLDQLRSGLGGERRLGECVRKMDWPQRGVYFFFEDGEERTDSGLGRRVVRVGTHAVSRGSKSSLWGRLYQHQGGQSGGGNHRGSVFRKLLGQSLGQRQPSTAVSSWGLGNTASREVVDQERELEQLVSLTIKAMPILWLDVDDEPSSNSLRSYIERNSIALLSNAKADVSVDPPSDSWLGHHCAGPRIRASGLWNSKHVEESYDPGFLEVMRTLVAAQLGKPVDLSSIVPTAVATTELASTKPDKQPGRSATVSTKPRTKKDYARLVQHLGTLGQTIATVSFEEVEKLIGGELPASARTYPAWWSGATGAVAWKASGWRASPDFQNGRVTFRQS